MTRCTKKELIIQGLIAVEILFLFYLWEMDLLSHIAQLP